MTDPLFSPLRAGALALANRLVMAPMARRRANEIGVPSEHAATYYAQRASAGLIITEGTGPSPGGKGSLRMPGIYRPEHVAGWRVVTDAVHARGGRIVAQLMHSGRMAHSSRMEGNRLPVAPSAVRPAGQVVTATGTSEYETPRALELAEIPGVIAEYGHAARCALEAGFDGVELHGASGFLPMQFLCSGTNLRTDRYGGSAVNRARFTVEALEAMIAVAGAERVGIKLSPEYTGNDIRDANPVETWTTVVQAISGLNLAYLHVSVGANVKHDYHALLRPLFPGAYFAGGGLTAESASEMLRAGRADAAVFGVLFLANPDLPERFRRGASLNAPDRDTFYTTGPKGYIDYPALG
jgi:N-ethylmaleimide reductase